MISFIARSVPFLKICYRCFFFFGISVFFSISIFVFVAVFSNANRAIEQHFTNWQAGKLKFSAVTTGKHTRVSTCACIVVLYRIILYILYAVQVPPHTHTHTYYTPWISLVRSLFACLSLSLCCGCHPITHVPAAHRVCRSPRISMDSYQAWVACYNYTQTHTHTIYLSI